MLQFGKSPGRSCVVCVVAVGCPGIHKALGILCNAGMARLREPPGQQWWYSNLLEKCEIIILGVFTQVCNF